MNNNQNDTEHTTNINTELAKERTHAAYDRTLMAWIRTALSLIGFGIGIFEFTQKTGGETIFRSSKMVGLLFVLLGITAMILALRENRLDHKELLKPQVTYKRRSSLGNTIGYGLIIIGLLAIYHITSQIIKLGL